MVETFQGLYRFIQVTNAISGKNRKHVNKLNNNDETARSEIITSKSCIELQIAGWCITYLLSLGANVAIPAME